MLPPCCRRAALPGDACALIWLSLALLPCLQPPREDPYDLLLRRYTAMGFSREEVAMALAIVGPDAQDDGDKIGALSGGQGVRCCLRRRYGCCEARRRRAGSAMGKIS